VVRHSVLSCLLPIHALKILFFAGYYQRDSCSRGPEVSGEFGLITDPGATVLREIGRVDSVVPEARQRRWELGGGSVRRAARCG